VQATVLHWDPQTQETRVVLDDGLELPVPSEVFARSGLRLLRLGQRVRIETTTEPTGRPRIIAMTLATFPLPT
jgi:2-phospho-L-lactate/phosphoenolpyruvate guanylyltransferase